jgi:putative component of membrane protein insertase Oxa1/YidC/SpoIIIJ protein YidD
MRQPTSSSSRHNSTASSQPGIVDSLAIAAINGYQRYLSPYKGFRCAHRVLYQGESCSQYVKRAVGEEGLLAAMQSSRLRFIECNEANQIIQERRRNDLLSIAEIAENENLTMSYVKSSKRKRKPRKIPARKIPVKTVEPHFLQGTTKKKNTTSAPNNCSCNRYFNWSTLENGCAYTGGCLAGIAGC